MDPPFDCFITKGHHFYHQLNNNKPKEAAIGHYICIEALRHIIHSEL